MALDLSFADWLDLAAASVLALLGIVVGALRPRNVRALSFATFCIGLASFYLAGTLRAPFFGELVARLLFVIGIYAIVALVPRTLGRRDAPALGMFTLVATVVISWGLKDIVEDGDDIVLGVIEMLGNACAAGSLSAFPILYFRANERAERRTIALLALGFTLFVVGTLTLTFDGLSIQRWIEILAVLAIPLTGWLYATRGPEPRIARNVALTIAASALAALFLALWRSDLVYPIGRMTGVLLLGYAVLRGEIAGLDLKIRFAISRGSIAAIFVVVFFVASELAQQFFAQRYSALVGILAAGMLVFALAPLQRAAERLAERAVPAAQGTPEPTRASEIYKSAVRAAMRDGLITRREERHLAEVARGLGLDPVQAHELMLEVEAGR